ncbi:DNA methyltransferase [Cupriavidus basilensis]
MLCELAYRWFCPVDGLVLDPFAGGSVRGLVAARLGRQYIGMDLRAEQVQANRAQLDLLRPDDPAPAWHVGDSRKIGHHLADVEADFLFSCPPYADLERYSDNPADLSTMDYPAFLTAYREVISGAVGQLRPDRFACFVVGDVRSHRGTGCYRNFVADTIEAFLDAGHATVQPCRAADRLGQPAHPGRQAVQREPQAGHRPPARVGVREGATGSARWPPAARWRYRTICSRRRRNNRGCALRGGLWQDANHSSRRLSSANWWKAPPGSASRRRILPG